MRLDTRTLLAVCALGVVVGALAACGGTSKYSASDQTIQKDAALFQVDQVERQYARTGCPRP